MLKYRITSEPIRDRVYDQLPSAVQDEIQRLHALSQKKPRAAIPELIIAIEQYPQLPLLFNYLSVAYSGIGEYKKAEAVVLENSRRHPDYLFARLNHAEFCLLRGEYDKVAEILDHKFDLKLLYPKRNLFHVSEVVAFNKVIGHYFWETGRPDLAVQCYEIARQIDPRSPLTRRLGAKVRPNWWQRLFRRRRAIP